MSEIKKTVINLEKRKTSTDLNQILTDFKISEEKILSENKYQAAQTRRLNDKYNGLVKQSNLIEQKANEKYDQISELLGYTKSEINNNFKKLSVKLKGFDKKINDAVSKSAVELDKSISKTISDVKFDLSEISQNLLGDYRRLNKEQIVLSEKLKTIDITINKLTDEFETQKNDSNSNIKLLKAQLAVQSKEHRLALTTAVEQQSKTIDKIAKRLTTLVQEIDNKNNKTVSKINKTLKKHEFSLVFQEKINKATKETTNNLINNAKKLRKKIAKIKSFNKLTKLKLSKLSSGLILEEKKGTRLEERTLELSKDLSLSKDTENKHFKGLIASVFVIMLGIIYILYNNYQNTQEIQKQQKKLNEVVTAENILAQEFKKQADQNLFSKVTQLEGQNKAHLSQIEILKQDLTNVTDNMEYINSSFYGLLSWKSFNGSQAKLYSSDWVKNKEDRNYTIKLFSNNDKKELFKFIARWGYYLDADIAAIKENTRNVLLYGDFATKEKARAALKNMPYNVRDKSLGITNFGSLKL